MSANMAAALALEMAHGSSIARQHGSSIALEMAARPDSLEQAQIQAARDASACQSIDEQAGRSNDNACDDVTMPSELSGRPDNLEEAQMQAATAASASSWTAYRRTTDETTGDDRADDTQVGEGPAPQEWLNKGWIDYSDSRRKPYPGEGPWYGWITYTDEEWQAWLQHQVDKAVRVAERGDDEDESPPTRQPYAKKVRAPSSPVSVMDVCNVFDRLTV